MPASILVDQISRQLDSVNDLDYELILVDDGSGDDIEIVKELAAARPRVSFIRFVRNFGKEAAPSPA